MPVARQAAQLGASYLQRDRRMSAHCVLALCGSCRAIALHSWLLTCSVLAQENAARLKAYKAKLVIFPKRSNKPKSGDSSAEELKNVPQFKGAILPLVHAKPQLETVKLTDELKVQRLLPHSLLDHHVCLEWHQRDGTPRGGLGFS